MGFLKIIQRSALTALAGIFLAAGGGEAKASKLVALVVGNETAQTRLNLGPKLRNIEERLFYFTSPAITDVRIFAGMNLTQDELASRLASFELQSLEEEETIGVVVYVGPVAHADDGTTFMVPKNWNGEDDRGLVGISGTLQLLKTRGRNYVVLDAVANGDVLPWKATTVKPGIGKLARYAAADRLVIAYVDAPLAGIAQPPLAEAFMKNLNVDRVQFADLPNLVHEEALFDGGGSAQPRKFGSLNYPLELTKLNNASEIEQRKERCHTARSAAAAAQTAAANTVTTEEMMHSTTVATGELTRRDFIEWFCPEWERPAGPAQKPTPGIAAKAPPARVTTNNQGNGAPRAASPPAARAYSAPPSGRSGWAANGVPIPN